MKHAELTAETILYLRGDGNYTHVVRLAEKPVIYSRTLCRFEEQFPHFLRCNKSHLVNPTYVLALRVVGSRESFFVMINGDEVPVSRRRFRRMCQLLAKFIHE